jgi:hypothetical protein
MLNDARCWIWDTPCQVLGQADGTSLIKSPRAGTDYRIEGGGKVQCPTDIRDKLKLTSWLVEQRFAGEAAPLVTQEILDYIQTRRWLTFAEKKERFFLALAAVPNGARPSQIYPLGQDDDLGHRLLAWTEYRDQRDIVVLSKLFERQGLVDMQGVHTSILAGGFEYLDAIQTKVIASRQGFIAMWFDPSMDRACEAIEAAISLAGYSPMQIGKKPHVNDINDEIIAEIRRSRFLVADATCVVHDLGEAKVGIVRGGVYYEAGFARGLGIPVFWTCREDCERTVHFDTNHISHIFWADEADLQQKLAAKISAVIGDGPLRPN